MTKAELVYLSYEEQIKFILANDDVLIKQLTYEERIDHLSTEHPDTIRGWALCFCSDKDLLKTPN